jgi:hypothetical protein
MKILLYDLETSPLTAHTWGLWQQNVAISQILESTEVMCFGARWLDGKNVKFRSVHHHGKQAMLEKIHQLMDEADVMVGWNSASFDRKHLNREFLQAGMTPPSPSRELDLMKVVKAQFRFPSNKLDYVAQTLGVGGKVSHTGFQLWLDCMAGDDKAWRLMHKYQVQDVQLLGELYEKLKPWMKWHPDKNIIDGTDDACTVCGGGLRQNGTFSSNSGVYQQWVCTDCGKYHKSVKRLRTSSVRSV